MCNGSDLVGPETAVALSMWLSTNSKSLVMGLIFAVAIAVIFVSRDSQIPSDEEDDSMDEFVPELPPLEPPKD